MSFDSSASFSAREIALKADTNVVGYIRNQNEERNKQAIAEGWLSWGSISESWADNFSSVYDYLFENAASEYSDTYKSLNGIRPRWISFSSMRLEEVEAMLEKLYEECRIAEQEEEDFKSQYPNAFRRQEEEDAAREQEWLEHISGEAQKRKAAEIREDQIWAIQDRLSGF